MRNLFYVSTLFVSAIVHVGCGDQNESTNNNCKIEPPMNKSSLTAIYELSEGDNSTVFGQGVFASDFRSEKYLMDNGDSCTGPVFHVNVGRVTDDSTIHYADVGAGCSLAIAGSAWFVNSVFLPGNHSAGKAVLTLLPDSVTDSNGSFQNYTELVLLPGGLRHSGFELSGSEIGIEELDQRIATNSDSVNVVLHEIGIADDQCATTEFRRVKVGSVIHTKKYEWEVLRIYLVNVKGINYSRVLVGRK